MAEEIKIKDDALPEPKRKKIRHTPWWVCLLAFFCGIFVTAGSVVAFTAVTPTKKVVSLFGGDPNKLLTESYQEQSIMALIIKLNTMSFNNLDSISEITPLIESLIVESLNPILEENLHFTLNWDELKDVEFTSTNGSTLGDYIFEQIKEHVALADFIKDKDQLKGVFQYFFYHPQYDENGNPIDGTVDLNNPYTLKDYINSDKDFYNGIIDQIRIKDVLTISENDKFLNTIKDWKIADFTDEKIKSIQISSFFKEEEIAGNTILQAMVNKGWSLKDLMDPTNIKGLKLKEVLNLSASSQIVSVLGDYTLGDIESLDLSKTLKVKDVFPNAEAPIIQQLGEYYLADLEKSETYNSIYIKDIIPVSEQTGIIKILCDQDATIGNLGTKVNALKLNEIIDISGEDPNSTKYKIVTALSEWSITEVGDHFQDLLIGDIFNVSSDPNDPNYNLVLYSLSSTSLNDLPDAISNLTIGQCIPIPEGSPFNKPEILNTPISDSDQFENALTTYLSLKDVVEINETSPAILQTLKDIKLKDIASVVQDITLSEVITIDETSPQILKSLQNISLFGDTENLENALTNLKLNQVFTESECSSGVMKILWNLEGYEGGNILISDLPSKLQNIKLVNLLEDKIYDDVSTKKVNGVWWYLLTESSETFDGSEGHRKFYDLGVGKNYTINDMNKLVDNMSWHMQNETINDLVEAGVISVDASLAGKLNFPSPLLGGRSIGSLTIKEFIEKILSTIPN